MRLAGRFGCLLGLLLSHRCLSPPFVSHAVFTRECSLTTAVFFRPVPLKDKGSPREQGEPLHSTSVGAGVFLSLTTPCRTCTTATDTASRVVSGCAHYPSLFYLIRPEKSRREALVVHGIPRSTRCLAGRSANLLITPRNPHEA